MKKRILIVNGNDYLTKHILANFVQEDDKGKFIIDIANVDKERQNVKYKYIFNYILSTYKAIKYSLKFRKIHYDLIVFHNLGDWWEICFAKLVNYKKSVVIWTCCYGVLLNKTSNQLFEFKKTLMNLRLYALEILALIINFPKTSTSISVENRMPFNAKGVDKYIVYYFELANFLRSRGNNVFYKKKNTWVGFYCTLRPDIYIYIYKYICVYACEPS